MDLSKLKIDTWLLIIVFIFAAVSPGLMYFYVFEEVFLQQTETIKLIALSISFTLPFLLANSLVYFFAHEHNPIVNQDINFKFAITIFLQSILVIIIFYFPYIWKYLFHAISYLYPNLNLTFTSNTYKVFVISTEIFMLFVISRHKKKDKSSKENDLPYIQVEE